MKLRWASPNLLGVWNAVSFVLSIFTQLAQVHLSLQGHLKATCVHQLQLQPQALGIKCREGKNCSQVAGNASDFLMNFNLKLEIGLEANSSSRADLARCCCKKGHQTSTG